MSDLEIRWRKVKDRLPDHVQLIAVSKTRSVDEIKALYDLGQRAFGENKAQEMREKRPELPEDIEWHFIGHLQTNKVKYIIPFVHLIHSIDRMELLTEVEKRAAKAGRNIDVLLQVHIATEEQKHGFSGPELQALIDQWSPQSHPHVKVRGLMGMATFTEDNDQIQREFKALARSYQVIAEKGLFNSNPFDILSMGMSGDIDMAIAQGSTMVRIGTSIFGPR